jgi:hypothetical protein
MNVQTVKETMRTWVADNANRYPHLCAAHLVGSITTMAEQMPFPDDKDVDLLLIFEPDSPALAHHGPFSNNLEFLHKGLMVEGGLKSATEYRDAEAVLANPEVAHHLTVDSILYDPQGRLTAMQPRIKREYNRRCWVQARVAHERRGWEQVATIYKTVPKTAILTRTLLMGYGFTYLSALLCVATLQIPTASFMKMHQILAGYDRLELYEAYLSLFGLDRATPELTRQLLQEGGEAFDLAVQIRRTPHPFQHKLYTHLRPYFVNKCRRFLDTGHPREALSWIMPFYLSSCDVIMADGTAAQKEFYAKRADRFLQRLGIDSLAVQQSKWAESRSLGEAIFSLADEIICTHPDIVA